LSDKTFYNINNVVWSPKQERAVIQYPDGYNTIYDFNTEQQYLLPQNWKDFSWSPQGNQIGFKSMGKYSENTWLATANFDGTGAQAVEHMGDNADKVIVSYSPNNQVLAFSETGEARGAFEEEVLLIGLNGENYKSMIVDGRGFEPVWAPQGDKIMYSVYSDENNYLPRLYLIGAQGDQIGSGKIDTGLNTWADKCTFDKNEEYIYCAVPKNLPQGSGMVRELAKDVKDSFYKIDIKTGDSFFLAEGAMGDYNIDKVYVSDDGTLLYFTEKDTGTLRYIKLQ
jgi:Tol biopolymer transport system component